MLALPRSWLFSSAYLTVSRRQNSVWSRHKIVKIVATDIYGAYGKTEELDCLDVACKRHGPLAVTGRSGSLEG